jgi:5-(carboxyamino)imidazole ribonucleotide synthase
MSTPFPLPPGSTVGIVGGGQLGRMLALAAARLGFRTAVLAREAGSPAGQVAALEIVGPYDDEASVLALAALCDVLTFEFENIPAEVMAALEAKGASLAPPSQALAISQDRVTEKTFLNAHGLPTTAFLDVQSEADIIAALEHLGAPALLKSRRGGYDGKGQAWVRSAADAAPALAAIGRRPAILEANAIFVRELSVIAARGRDGALAVYPLVENHHENGVLRRSLAPAIASAQTRADAVRYARTLLGALSYVGVLGLELFELEDGRLLVNEFAPRVHNSGHWTLDGCEVDQFEQHIRAVAGWPLGPTAPLARTEMLNLLSDEAEDWAALAADPSARVWLYGKRGSAPGRKMGHVNRLSPL